MCAALLLVAMYTASAIPLERIVASESSSYMYDTHGRVRVFHGFNAVSKNHLELWYPSWFLHNTTLMDELAWMGFNSVRLGWMWTGFEHEEGVFNNTFFETIQTIVNNFGERGIHTLLDTHQDCLSTKFCLYDGAPLWLVNKSTPKKAFPWPLTGNCSSRGWMANELTEAADHAYQDLYDNTKGMRDNFVAFWTESAKRWVGNTNILGYELINEPFAGDIYAKPDLLLPGIAGSQNLQPFYHNVAAGVREHDDETLIFYEPVTWGMIFDNAVAGSGFTEVPGGVQYSNRSVLSFHYYCDSFQSAKSREKHLVCDDTIGPLVFDAIQKDLKTLGGSSMMTEFGGCDDAPFKADCIKSMNLADQHFTSWTMYDGFGQGAPMPGDEYWKTFSRTYARAIAGDPQSMSYDPVTKDFEVCYSLDPRIPAPTEIYANFPWHYPAGANVTSTPNLVIAIHLEDNVIRAETVVGAAVGSRACVWISPL